MPEGDTIFRAARTLDRALGGQTVTGFETHLPKLARIDDDQPLVGRTVQRVTASGKWMHMHFSGDLVLLTHMLMSGSWHIYRPGEPWRMSRYHMRIVVATERMVAVAFHVQVAEFHTEASLARRPGFSRLGPDILADDFDAGAVVANLAGRPDLDAGVALMTQSLLAGVGNVYKSESCFLAGVNPFRKVAELTLGELQTLVAVARKLMRANIAEGAFRRTTGRSDPAERLWVYHRGGEPCRRCGTVILSQKQGIDARVTFWCPQCQH